ncbi:nucleotide-binding universal stress UspA family protein [Kitasatospora sp. MAP12-15]|uniref:universal stress protein n=1 Tax=unclassified Kitasatospora TaxID=2633591 RepID=UPI002476D29F|nr:universal stress protein [Kitasatospora sp. MAP12-44]MDH6108660.1 nucleotide-binding universal stress UspA family protein [Kitasatospora sp. MAP12-44]
MRPCVTVGVDGTDASHDALDWAADEAWLRRLPLHVVHAWPGEAQDAPIAPGARSAADVGEEALEAARAQVLMRHPDLEVATRLADRAAREALLDAAADTDLLVVGARGSGGFPRLLVGSTALHVAANASCPVVVVHGSGYQEAAGGVLVGVHGRDAEEEVLSFAFRAADSRQLPLEALHAWSYPLVSGPGHAFPPVYEAAHVAAEQSRLLAEVLAGWSERHPGVPLSETAVRSSPARELVALSETRQLLVVGRHGTPRGPLRRLGSVSQAVVQHAQCPVAVVPVTVVPVAET